MALTAASSFAQQQRRRPVLVVCPPHNKPLQTKRGRRFPKKYFTDSLLLRLQHAWTAPPVRYKPCTEGKRGFAPRTAYSTTHSPMFSHLASISKRKPDAHIPRWTIILAGAGTPATSNLRMYIAQAQLPPMVLGRDVPRVPTDGHKTHRNTLSVRVEEWRKLAQMTVIPCSEFDDHASECTSI